MKVGLGPTVIKNVQVPVGIACCLPTIVPNAIMEFLLIAAVCISFIVCIRTFTKHTIFDLCLFLIQVKNLLLMMR